MVNQPLRPQPQAKPVVTALPVETRGRAAAGRARLGSLFAVRRSHRNVGAVVLEIVVVHHTERLPAHLQAAQCGLRCVNGVRAAGAWRTPQRTRRRIARWPSQPSTNPTRSRRHWRSRVAPRCRHAGAMPSPPPFVRSSRFMGGVLWRPRSRGCAAEQWGNGLHGAPETLAQRRPRHRRRRNSEAPRALAGCHPKHTEGLRERI